MPKGATIANAYYQLMPSMEGATGSITSAIMPEATRAGNMAGSTIGGLIGGKLKSGAKVIGAGLVAGFGLATAAAGAFAKSSLDVGKAFDSSMSQVAATMGFTTEELNDVNSAAYATTQQLRDFAKEMGAKTAFSATQAADALNYMALAGYDAETSMKMLPGVLNLAAAGGMDLARASDMVTDSQSALGLSLDETAELVDKMARASSISNTSVEQLGDAILTVGGTAKNLAGGTTELSAALGILADNGIKGAEGGTALRNIILSLSAPTDKAAKTLKDLGVEVYDAEGNMRDLNSIFLDLNSSMEGMTQGEKTEVLNTLFNKVDLKSANALLANCGDRFDELTESIDNASGAAENMANVQLDNLEGDMTLFQSALEGVQIQLSDALTPALREFVEWGTDRLGDVSNFVTENQELFDGLASTLSGALSTGFEKVTGFVEFAIENLGKVANFVGDNADEFGQLGDALGGALSTGIDVVTDFGQFIIDNFSAVASLTGGVAAAFGAFKAAMAISGIIDAFTTALGLATAAEDGMAVSQGLLNAVMEATPIVRIVTLIAGLVAALVIAYNTNEDFRNAVDSVFGWIGGFIGGAIEAVTGFLSDLGSKFEEIGSAIGEWAEGVKEFWSGVGDKAGEIFQGVQDTIGGAWDAVSSKTNEIWTSATEFLSGKFDELKSNAEIAFGSIKDTISTDLDTAKTVGSEAGSALTSALNGDWDGAKEHAAAAYDAIKENITSKLDAAKSQAVSIADQIGEKLGFPGLGATVAGVFDGVKAAIEDPIGTARDFIQGAMDRISSIITGAKLELPHIKLPHFNIDGGEVPWGIGGKGHAPTISIDWYKAGGFINDPTVLGASDDGVSVGGEAGLEFVWPGYEPYFKRYAAAIAEHMPAWEDAGSGIDIHDCTFIVRKESDIDEIAEALYRKVERERRGLSHA